MTLDPQRLLQHLQLLLMPHAPPEHEKRTLRLAYSGGLDSHVLLHFLAMNRDRLANWRLEAVHINHGLHDEAENWSRHCETVCENLGVPCRMIKVEVSREGESIEASARDARYAALADCLEPGDILLTAQHADDQAETFMLQMLRGSGPRGLSAMPESRAFARGVLVRPLLGTRREALHAYANEHRLAFIHDPSNDDLRFDRNFLRQEIMPRLQARWPAVVPILGQNARQQAEAARLLDILAEQDLRACEGSSPGCLSLTGLALFDETRQRNILRYWLRQRGLTVPQRRKLNEVLRAMLSAAHDRQPHIDWPGGEVRRYRDELYAEEPVVLPPDWETRWDMQGSLQLPAGLGSLEARTGIGQGLDAECLAKARVNIRFRRGGEACLPVGRGHHHSLKKLFQESAIPPWQRQRIPLVYVDDELAQVMGVCICEPYQAVEGQPAITIHWQQCFSSP